MKNFRYQIPVSTLHKHIEIIPNIKYLTELHQIPHTTRFQLRQPIQRRTLQPLEHILGINILQKTLVAHLLQVADVVFIGSSEKCEAVGEKFFVLDAAVNVVQKRVAGFDRHVSDIDGGKLFFF